MEQSLLIRSLGEDNSVRDESLFTGHAFSASSPQTTEEVCEIVRHCLANGVAITPHGGLTGINGAGTAAGNHSMSLQHLNGLTYRKEDDTLWAQAGATFSEIENIVRKESNMTREFPASPTEKSATVGGAISFHASGLRSYKYGSVSDFVMEIEYCDCHGHLHFCNISDDDLHDLFGSEGMFAIITGVRLRTVATPKALWGLMFFFPDNLYAAEFADAIMDQEHISVFEFCDSKSFEFVHEFRSQISSISRIPDIPSSDQSAIYLELEGEDEEILEAAAENLLDLTATYHGDPDNVWTVTGNEVESFRLLRHAISECINLKAAQFHARDVRIKKISCSCSFPDKNSLEIIKYYQDSLTKNKLTGIIFGHIGSGRPYVNILSHSSEEYDKAMELIEEWCSKAYKSRGCAFFECGVGKLYRDTFYKSAPIDLLNKRIKSKQKWDPDGLFNPENMLLQI
ncbi:FAD-binding oxidoreductase [Lachnospiraceae bacterium MD308]|nr:FAD-binding oxidoreductase [Lachnospiraceae bacterium MD308]